MKYNVLIDNDDQTPFDFMAELLIVIFDKKGLEAIQLSKKIHKEGLIKVGCFDKDIANQKVHEVQAVAKEKGYPIVIRVEVEKNID